MTEYWVSQGNKWCDFCKIFISNNPSSIRNHELGQRHKDNVAKRLVDMRKQNAAKEKEEKEAARAIQQIEAKAQRSYQKDVASFQARDSNAGVLSGQESWEYDESTGYYYNPDNGLFHDSTSGFYYSDSIGKWVNRQEAYSSVSANSKPKGPGLKKASLALGQGSNKDIKGTAKPENGPAPGPVVSASLNPTKSVKGAPSSLTVGKRKRPEDKQKPISKEEAAALKARAAARKRVEEREKPLLGLYNGSR